MRKQVAKILKWTALPTLLWALAGAPSSAQTESGPWNPGANSRARLLAAGAPEQGLYRAGIEIELKSGAHTYWRDPGDAGVPPVLITEGSRNVKSAILRFPAPSRIDENGLTVYGYRNNLILPMEIVPEDAKAPVHLNVRFTYAACEKICIPAELSGAIDLSVDAPKGTQAQRLAQAIRLLPTQVQAEQIALSANRVEGTAKPSWRIDVKPGFVDLFAEGPAGWNLDTKAEKSGFALTSDGRPQNWQGPVPVILTLKGAADVEVKIDLPLPDSVK
jgi:DsbC/DsbD-like thiol-disulfide interchange protein